MDTDVAEAPATPSQPEPVNVQVDYFGFARTERIALPDGRSFVEAKVLTEGERRNFLNETNREVKFSRGTGDAAMRLRPGDDRYHLLRISLVDWNLVRNGSPVPFTRQMLDQFLANADPRVIDHIEREVRKLNPWLLQEMELEDMIRERDDLNEMIETKRQEEAGKLTSSSR